MPVKNGIASESSQSDPGSEKRHPFMGGVSSPRAYSLVTGLPAEYVRLLYAASFSGFPAGLFPFLGPLIGGCSCRVPYIVSARWAYLTAAYMITGTLLIAIDVPFVIH